MDIPENHETNKEPEAEPSKPAEETEGEQKLRTGELFTVNRISSIFDVEFTVEELSEIYHNINSERETVVVERWLFERIVEGYSKLVKRSAGYERAIAKAFAEQNR